MSPINEKILELAEKNEAHLANDTGNLPIIQALLEQNENLVAALVRADIEFRNCEFKRKKFKLNDPDFEILSHYMQAILPIQIVAGHAINANAAELKRIAGGGE